MKIQSLGVCYLNSAWLYSGEFICNWLVYWVYLLSWALLDAGCLVQRSGWTRDPDVFFLWLSSIPFNGGGFNDAAIAEGLSEALMVCMMARFRLLFAYILSMLLWYTYLILIIPVCCFLLFVILSLYKMGPGFFAYHVLDLFILIKIFLCNRWNVVDIWDIEDKVWITVSVMVLGNFPMSNYWKCILYLNSNSWIHDKQVLTTKYSSIWAEIMVNHSDSDIAVQFYWCMNVFELN